MLDPDSNSVIEGPMGLELSQRTGIVSQISIALRENSSLQIEKRSGLKTIRKELPLTSLSPELVHTGVLSLRWMGASAVTALLALAGGLTAYYFPSANGPFLFAGAAFALAAFVCASKAYRAYQGRYACLQAATGTEVISIGATPDGKRFAASLRDAIESVRYDASLSDIRRSEQHKKHVEFLLGEGVLTPAEFSSIMSRMERKASLARLGRH